MSKSQHRGRGEYVNKTIVKLWDGSNTFHIELEGGEQMNVCAPIGVETSIESMNEVWLTVPQDCININMNTPMVADMQQLCNLSITFAIFVLSQHLIARNLCELFSFIHNILHLNKACCINELSDRLCIPQEFPRNSPKIPGN